ncbi:2OG-Fe(II) oxygenase family protein [Aliivibrio logei]|uniref:2OG-Fe(II) oxygenase family protein n=1 Tax=Aliivibrio logei TaxID=688 RepID=UPI0035C895A2
MKLEAIDYTAENAAELFVKSLRETGFGVLKNHPIQQELVQSIYDNWYEFFNSEEKENFHFNVETQDGFFPASVSEVAKGHTKKDIKEYYHYYPTGQCPAQLKTQIQEYYDNANVLAAELLSWVEKYSPEDVSALYSQSLSSMVENSDKTLLRVLHYPPLEGDWLDVPCDFGNLIINIGDMLQEASGGYYPSTTHRVINPEGADKTKSRISLPLFLHPKPEVVLSERHTANSYLMERLRELGVI